MASDTEAGTNALKATLRMTRANIPPNINQSSRRVSGRVQAVRGMVRYVASAMGQLPCSKPAIKSKQPAVTSSTAMPNLMVWEFFITHKCCLRTLTQRPGARKADLVPESNLGMIKSG